MPGDDQRSRDEFTAEAEEPVRLAIGCAVILIRTRRVSISQRIRRIRSPVRRAIPAARGNSMPSGTRPMPACCFGMQGPVHELTRSASYMRHIITLLAVGLLSVGGDFAADTNHDGRETILLPIALAPGMSVAGVNGSAWRGEVWA